MRQRYRYRDGQMVGDDGLPMINQAERSASPAAPFTISDCQPPLASQTNGVIYDSKSEMRKEYKRAGVVEVGTDTAANRVRRTWSEERDKRKKQREQIKGALHKAHSRMGYGAP